jgi:hypothetical protein
VNDLQLVHHCGYEQEYVDPKRKMRRKLQIFPFIVTTLNRRKRRERENVHKIVVINHQTERTFAYF